MLPSMDPQKMQEMLKKLGMKMDNIQANQVIIKTDSGDITIDEPQVIKTTMKGQVVFQVSGNVKEKTFTDEDVKLIVEQTNVKDEEKIKKLLQQNNGDVAKTIIQLKE
jgi:nascent polypeptide-associated complex subunit alpha